MRAQRRRNATRRREGRYDVRGNRHHQRHETEGAAPTRMMGRLLSIMAGALVVIISTSNTHISYLEPNIRTLREAYFMSGLPQQRQLPLQPATTRTASACIKNETLQIQPKDHPYAGARDSCGNWGYKHDPKAAFRQQSFDEIDYSQVCKTPLGKGSEGPGGYQALQKIKIAKPISNSNKPLRLLCMIYSVETPHSDAMVQAVLETWGHKCDGFMVASNVTKPSIGAVNIPHLGPEEYGTIWQKVRSMWAYVHDNYLDDYDFVYISGEDTYVIVENLRQMMYEAHMGTLYKDPKWRSTLNREVETWEEKHALDGKERPLYLGAIMPLGTNRYLCAGGAGYVLNRPSIQRVIQNLPYTHADRLDSREDFFVAAALRNQSVACSDTRDSTGAWRFHHLDAEFQYNYNRHSPAAVWSPPFLEKSRGIRAELGLDGVSESSVSFHLTGFKNAIASPERLRRYHAILYGHCDSKASRIQSTKEQ